MLDMTFVELGMSLDGLGIGHSSSTPAVQSSQPAVVLLGAGI